MLPARHSPKLTGVPERSLTDLLDYGESRKALARQISCLVRGYNGSGRLSGWRTSELAGRQSVVRLAKVRFFRLT